MVWAIKIRSRAEKQRVPYEAMPASAWRVGGAISRSGARAFRTLERRLIEIIPWRKNEPVVLDGRRRWTRSKKLEYLRRDVTKHHPHLWDETQKLNEDAPYLTKQITENLGERQFSRVLCGVEKAIPKASKKIAREKRRDRFHKDVGEQRREDVEIAAHHDLTRS